MQYQKSSWQGLGAIVVVRQSDDSTGTASTAAQLDYMSKELDRVGMRLVDKEVLEGIPGSAPARLHEIMDKLFARKKQKNDFSVSAWQIEDRASRSGGEHGMWLQHECKRRGILMFFAGDEYDAVPFAPVVRVAKYEAAKDVSVSNGRRSAQGQKWAQKQGFFRTAGPTPMGCDRIYYGGDDKPKYIIHNLPNGLQEQRDYATGTLIGTFGTIGTKSRNRFRKQRNEYSLLIPGNREQRRVVRVIFYLRYKRGLRGARIADYLNRNGIPSPKGREWSQRQVQIIYENEAYTGVTYNDQTYSGRFFRRDRHLGFVALNRDEFELVMKKTFSPKLRPMEDWERIDQPHMYNFLPRDVRDLAIAALEQMWQERADPTRPRREINSHPASDYLLSGKLRAVQDNELLRGTLSGPPDHKVLYYRHPRSKRGRRKKSIFTNLIPAQSLHEAITSLLAERLADAPDLRERLTRHVMEQRAAAVHDEPDVVELEAERDAVKAQINLMVRSLKGAALADLQDELQRLGARRNAIEARLAEIGSRSTRDARPVDEVVDAAVEVLKQDSRRLLTLPIEPLRELVSRMVIEAKVDMATKAVELTIALPTWALEVAQQKKKVAKNGQKPASDADNALCPPDSWRSPVSSETHRPIPLFGATCQYQHLQGSNKSVCYRCTRTQRAA
jgi:hypothetical protein